MKRCRRKIDSLQQLDLELASLLWTGALTAIGGGTVSLGLGARYLPGQMRLDPGVLLRSGAWRLPMPSRVYPAGDGIVQHCATTSHETARFCRAGAAQDGPGQVWFRAAVEARITLSRRLA